MLISHPGLPGLGPFLASEEPPSQERAGGSFSGFYFGEKFSTSGSVPARGTRRAGLRLRQSPALEIRLARLLSRARPERGPLGDPLLLLRSYRCKIRVGS